MLRLPKPPRRFVNGALVVALASLALFEGACVGPPAITCSASPSVLTPADGTIRPVTVTVSASVPTVYGPQDSSFTLTSVDSNQPITPADYPGFTPGTVYPAGTTSVSGAMRAAATPNTHGRQYRIAFTASDSYGSSTCYATVQVRPR